MQLVGATCGPDVTHLAPSTLRSLSHWLSGLSRWPGYILAAWTNLTIGHPCIVCVCARAFMRFSAFRRVCVCVCVFLKVSAFIQQTTAKHSWMQECARIAACARVLRPITVCLAVVLRALPSPLLAAAHKKKTVGGYWAFPIHHQNTKHSPTLFYKFTRNTTSIYFLRVCICTYPIYLLTRQPRDTIH